MATAHIIQVFLFFHQYYDVLPKDNSQRKSQGIQCGSNPGPLDYKSNTLQLSYAGPLLLTIRRRLKLYRQVKGEPFPKQALVFTCLQCNSFENTVGKGEIARNEQFLPFPTVFSIHIENSMLLSLDLKWLSASFLSLEESKMYRLGKG